VAKCKNITSGKKGLITRLFNQDTSIPDISSELGISITLVRQYVLAWCREQNDDLWSKIIRQVGHCEISGRTDELNAHHILEKGAFGWLRWDLSNGICLNVNYHQADRGNIQEMSAHGTVRQTQMFLDWLKENRPGQYRFYCDNKDNRVHEDVDIIAKYHELKEIYEKGL